MSQPVLDYETPRPESPRLPSLSSLPTIPLITQGPPLPRVNLKLRNWAVLALTLAATGAVLFLSGAGRMMGLALLLIALPLAALTALAGLLALPSAQSRSGIIGSVLLATAVLLLIVLVLKADPMFGEMLKQLDH